MSAIELTPRQTEVAQLLVQGCSNLEIATHLEISVDTVKHHLCRIFQRAGICSGRKRVRLATVFLQA